MSFEDVIPGIVAKHGALRLQRTPLTEVEVEDMKILCSSPGLRLLSVMVGNLRIGKWEAEDWNENGVGVECVKLAYPFTVPTKIHLFIDLKNPTDKPIGVRWAVKVKKPLFCVALERRIAGNQWEPDTVYCHAFTAPEATRTVLASELNRSNVRVVSCGKVIGYHAHDDHGKVLSV